MKINTVIRPWLDMSIVSEFKHDIFDPKMMASTMCDVLNFVQEFFNWLQYDTVHCYCEVCKHPDGII